MLTPEIAADLVGEALQMVMVLVAVLVVPGLVVGLLLFMVGAVLGYLYVLPQTLRVLFSFQSEAIAPFITYDNYFGFVLQVCLALGISFELPLILICELMGVPEDDTDEEGRPSRDMGNRFPTPLTVASWPSAS